MEANFRTVNTPDARAMAGLSMGGSHTIRNGLTHPELFHYVGIFSMGLGLGNNGAAQVADYEKANDAALKRDAKDLKLSIMPSARTISTGPSPRPVASSTNMASSMSTTRAMAAIPGSTGAAI